MITPQASTSASASSSTAQSPALLPPQILLLGLRRSGKSSLLQVLYNHLPPNDTLFLESTLKPYSVRLDLWGPCNIWDGISSTSILQTAGRGGHVVAAIPTLKWHNVKTLIWVLDAQDDYLTSLASLHSLIVLAYAHNPAIRFHVFLHKMDGLSEDYRDDTQTDIEKRIDDNLSDASSTFAFAQGVEAPAESKRRLEQAAKSQSQNQAVNLATLDWNKLETQVARGTDDTGQEPVKTSPPPAKSQQQKPPGSPPLPNLETDVDLTIHQTSIFDSSIFVAFSRVLQPVIFSRACMKAGLIRLVDSLVDACQFDKLFLVHLPTRTFLVNDSSPFDKISFDVVCDYLGFLVSFSTLFANLKPGQQQQQQQSQEQDQQQQQQSSHHHRSFSSSTLRLNADNLIAFWQVDASLATIAILRSDAYDRTSALIDSNINVFRKAIAALLSTHNGNTVQRNQLDQALGKAVSSQ